MDTEIDWQRELDRAFGAGPDADVAHYLESGRRAVRRRRAVAAALVTASLAIVGGAVWATSPGAATRGDAPVATHAPRATDPADSSADGTDDQDEAAARRARLERMRQEARDEAVDLGNPGALTPDGRLVLAPGAGPVLQRVANPMDYTAEQGHSLGIRVMMQGSERYVLLTVYPDASSATDASSTGDFPGWLAQAVRSQRTLDVADGVTASGGDTGDQPWLVLGPGGGVEGARAGVVIVEERTGLDLGERFADGAGRVGVVRLLVDGRSEFAAYRVIDGTLDVVPAGGSFTSMGAFVTWAREQYASGEGMR